MQNVLGSSFGRDSPSTQVPVECRGGGGDDDDDDSKTASF
jgi:hypothetical protein